VRFEYSVSAQFARGRLSRFAEGNDWGGISPVTKYLINPEAAWPQISSLGLRSAGAGFALRERLAIYPEFSSRPEFVSARLQPHVVKLQAENGYARERVKHVEAGKSKMA
jgi:FO synthase